MKYIGLLKRAIVLDGHIVEAIGPYDSIREVFCEYYKMQGETAHPFDIKVISVYKPGE